MTNGAQPTPAPAAAAAGTARSDLLRLATDADARTENVRRTAEVSRLLADAGTIVIVSLISPYAAARARARVAEEVGRLVDLLTALGICPDRGSAS